MLGRRYSEVIQITNGGSAPALGNKLQYRIPRRSNLRLETIVLHANLSVTATTRPDYSATFSKNGLEGIFDEVRLKVSDAGGSGRAAVKAPSAFLTHWNRDRVGRAGRYTQKAIGNSATFPTTGTYDIMVPVHIFPPNINSAIANRFSLPLSDRIGEKGDIKGVDDDPILEIDIASALTSIGILTGACTFNYLLARLEMREISPALPYIPTQLDYGLQNAFTAVQETAIDIPTGGHLMAIGVEEFSTSSTKRTDALDTTAATLGFWKLRYGRTELQTWSTKQMKEWNGGWIQEYPDGTTGFTADKNAQYFHVLDLLHDVQVGEAISGNSCLNLYTENKGDSAKLIATRPNTNTQVGLGFYKMFGPIEALNAA